jgi:carbon monoxide dehydrogenase subunit G
MQLEGTMPTKCPPGKVVENLRDPQILSLMVPEGCHIGEKVGDTINFVIQRKVGPISFKMPGTMTVTQKPGADAYVMELNASHLIGGKANVTLNLTPERDAAGQQSLHWLGTLEAHGLAAHLIEERTAKIGNVLKNLFVRLRKQAETPA